MNDIDNTDLSYPCALCMGFCQSNEKSLRCNFCMNSFHQSCSKISHKAFADFTNPSSTSQYKCSICSKTKCCDYCNCNTSPSNSLYCITCLKTICDSCNSISSDQIHNFRTTNSSFYCSYCSLIYPCIICEEHCFNDSVHQPSIQCDKCQRWIHHKCSRLTIKQFNRYGLTDLPYFCPPCLNQTLPFNQISDAALRKQISNSTNFIQTKPVDNIMPIGSCSLCLECNPDCDTCDVCPNSHRICDKCINCKYLKASEMNSLITNKSLHDLSLMHFKKPLQKLIFN